MRNIGGWWRRACADWFSVAAERGGLGVGPLGSAKTQKGRGGEDEACGRHEQQRLDGSTTRTAAADPEPRVPPRTPAAAMSPKSRRPCAAVRTLPVKVQNCGTIVEPIRPLTTYTAIADAALDGRTNRATGRHAATARAIPSD